MEVHCENCHEPWDVYHIVHDEGLLEHLESLPKDYEQDTIHFKNYEIVNLCGYNEISEGHFLILHCPCCKKVA